MVKKTTTITPSSDESRDQLLSSIKTIELIPAKSSVSSFITVHIGNCTMRITDQSDLSLLRKISEAFDHD